MSQSREQIRKQLGNNCMAKKKRKTTDDAVEILYDRYVKDDPEALAELEKMRAEEEATEYQYGDRFKEDLIHQLYHLVQEVKGIREEISEFNKTHYRDANDLVEKLNLKKKKTKIP